MALQNHRIAKNTQNIHTPHTQKYKSQTDKQRTGIPKCSRHLLTADSEGAQTILFDKELQTFTAQLEKLYLIASAAH